MGKDNNKTALLVFQKGLLTPWSLERRLKEKAWSGSFEFLTCIIEIHIDNHFMFFLEQQCQWIFCVVRYKLSNI